MSDTTNEERRAFAEQIRPWVPNTYMTLGTDGFGFSDTRPAARRLAASSRTPGAAR